MVNMGNDKWVDSKISGKPVKKISVDTTNCHWLGSMNLSNSVRAHSRRSGSQSPWDTWKQNWYIFRPERKFDTSGSKNAISSQAGVWKCFTQRMSTFLLASMTNVVNSGSDFNKSMWSTKPLEKKKISQLKEVVEVFHSNCCLHGFPSSFGTLHTALPFSLGEMLPNPRHAFFLQRKSDRLTVGTTSD